MVFGMSLSAFTTLHTVLSLIGIVAGLVVLFQMLRGQFSKGWTWLFLFTTVLTSVTGYGFPASQILPSHIVGGISLAVLAIALYALFGKRLAGGWRAVYVVTAAIALYLNCFVGVVQAFMKLPPLHALAPTGSEPPFATAQLATLAFFIVAGFVAFRRFHPAAEIV
jgi:hypothetical protein